VQPAPDVRTLILANLSRMQTTAGLRAELENLAAHSRVRGEVIDVDAVTAINALYAGWDAGTATANDVLFAEGGLHDYILSLLNTYPGVENLMIIGGDSGSGPATSTAPSSCTGRRGRSTTISACDRAKPTTPSALPRRCAARATWTPAGTAFHSPARRPRRRGRRKEPCRRPGPR
ncbi:MAG: hypothetical protein GY856_17940, partial [bacterium]|nr:hypothetical protein [bacterium]